MAKIYKSIFNNVRNTPKGFDYKPRYYDERKESLEQRIRLIEVEVAEENREAEIAKVRIQSKMQAKFARKSGSRADRGRSLRLVIILGILLVLASFAYSYLDQYICV